ncbi:helix-turn-helix domain-containing protein, partial [Streptomyces sp. NPDC127084]|uniref:helix-turn-helix domain-containing protein n=1 Tax=Streptomyces sp. NPDC127084 TaxID=3347133 RepID=UPI00365B7D6E
MDRDTNNTTAHAAIDALLAGVREEVPLPSPELRRRLREDTGLSRAQVARAVGVSASTMSGWEAGREPSGAVRERYAYFLEQAQAKLNSRTAAADSEPTETTADTPDDVGQDDLAVPQPCVLCGQPAHHQVEGFPQHLDPADCGSAQTVPAADPFRDPKPARRTEAGR